MTVFTNSLSPSIRTAVFIRLFQCFQRLFLVHRRFIVNDLIYFVVQLSILTLNIVDLAPQVLYQIFTVFNPSLKINHVTLKNCDLVVAMADGFNILIILQPEVI